MLERQVCVYITYTGHCSFNLGVHFSEINWKLNLTELKFTYRKRSCFVSSIRVSFCLKMAHLSPIYNRYYLINISTRRLYSISNENNNSCKNMSAPVGQIRAWFWRVLFNQFCRTRQFSVLLCECNTIWYSCAVFVLERMFSFSVLCQVVGGRDGKEESGLRVGTNKIIFLELSLSWRF